jgi:hypothetical protein
MRVSKIRLVRVANVRRFVLRVITPTPPCNAFNQFCRVCVKANHSENQFANGAAR